MHEEELKDTLIEMRDMSAELISAYFFFCNPEEVDKVIQKAHEVIFESMQGNIEMTTIDEMDKTTFMLWQYFLSITTLEEDFGIHSEDKVNKLVKDRTIKMERISKKLNSLFGLVDNDTDIDWENLFKQL